MSIIVVVNTQTGKLSVISMLSRWHCSSVFGRSWIQI